MPVNIDNIESGGTGAGKPDMYFRTEVHDLWIELKELKRWPKNPQITLKPDWRPGQISWISKHKRRGGKVLLMVTYHNQWFLLKEIKKEYSQKEIFQLSLIPQDFKAINDYQLLKVMNTI